MKNSRIVKLLTFWCLFLSSAINAQDGDLAWVARYKSDFIGGVGTVQSLTTNATGNVFAVGYVSGTNVDFDPNDDPAAVHNITGSTRFSAFITKLDANKVMQWTLRFGGSGQAKAYSVVKDGLGNLFVTGSFSGQISFGSTSLTATGSEGIGNDDIFFLKVTEDGDLLWARKIDGTAGTNIGNSVAVDATGNVYMSGTFNGSNVDFNPGGAAMTLSSSGQDAFIAKYDNNGNSIWAKVISGSGSAGDVTNSLVVDASGNVYATGGFSGTADLDPGAGVVAASAAAFNMDIFVLRLDSNGNYVWSKTVTTSGTGDQGFGITLSPANEVIITGSVGGGSPVNFDGVTVPSFGFWDIFVWNLSAANGSTNWAKIYGGSGIDEGRAVTTDASGNIFVTGRFDVSADFGGTNLSAGSAFNQTEVFILKLNNAGTSTWAKQLENNNNGATSTVFGHTIVAQGNALYIGGVYEYTTDFDPGAGTHNLTPQAIDEAFILKLSISGTALSLQLTSFTASIINEALNVNWTVAHDRDIRYFEVELSKDGKNFVTAGKVYAKELTGNVMTTLSYSFTQPAGASVLWLISFAALGFAGITGRKKWKQVALSLFVILTVVFTACNKNNIVENDTDGTLFVRVVQVDQDGNKDYSKIQKVVKE